jgi:hypothetical protein
MSDDLLEVQDDRNRTCVTDYAFLIEHRPNVDESYLLKKAAQGWTLISVDQGIFYFRRAGRHLYEEIDGKLVERAFGRNS